MGLESREKNVHNNNLHIREKLAVRHRNLTQVSKACNNNNVIVCVKKKLFQLTMMMLNVMMKKIKILFINVYNVKREGCCPLMGM